MVSRVGAGAAVQRQAPQTREAYLRSVRQLVDHFDKEPPTITERELEDCFLFRRTESRWKPATLRLCYAGIKCYYRTVLDQSCKLFAILHVEEERTLPLVLTQEEVARILAKVTTFQNYVYSSSVYCVLSGKYHGFIVIASR